MSQQDGKLNDVAKGAADATQKAAQNITPDLSELPDPTNLPNPFDDTGFADKVLPQPPLSVKVVKSNIFAQFLFKDEDQRPMLL